MKIDRSPPKWVVKDSKNVKQPKASSSKTDEKTFKKKVQAIINKNVEDKQAYKNFSDINYNSGISSSADLNFLIPNIANGNTDSSRIGDQIHAKKLVIQGHMISNLTLSSYSDCRIGVRMMIVQPKSYIGYDAINSSASTWLAYLLKKGATTTAFTGSVSDFYAPINRDSITVYADKHFYVNAPYVPGSVTNDLSTRNSTKFFKISLKVKNKLLKYDTANNSGLTPTNYNPVLILGYCHLDNSTPDTITTQINLSFISTLDYQDA